MRCVRFAFVYRNDEVGKLLMHHLREGVEAEGQREEECKAHVDDDNGE
jgi:hypothetical protein